MINHCQGLTKYIIKIFEIQDTKYCQSFDLKYKVQNENTSKFFKIRNTF